MRAKYPRIGRSEHQRRWERLPADQGPRCIVCGAKATHKVHVEFDIFRGDDEVMKACGVHSGDVLALVGAWQVTREPIAQGASTVSPGAHGARPNEQDPDTSSVDQVGRTQ